MSELGIRRDAGVLEIVLDRPTARNALSRAMTEEIGGILAAAETDPEVAVVLLAGGTHFAAGADVAEMAALPFDEAVRADFCGCADAVGRFTKPVVAAVDGVALGGGCELIEMCDIVVASDRAQFGHPEIILGTMPGCGGTQRLPRAIGRAKAMDLLLTGRRMGADEAERCGLVSRVVPAAELMRVAWEIARHLTTLPVAVTAMIKRAVNASFAGPLEAGLDLERRLFHRTLAMAESREGMAAFLEKRPARFPSPQR